MIELSIVVPVYNARSIKKIIDAFSVLDQLQTEIILIDDCSEKSAEYKTELAAIAESNVRYYRTDINLGQDKATALGIHHASGKYIVTIDDDLEFPPLEILKLYRAIIDSSLDIVYGIPSKPKNSLFRAVTRKFFYRLVHILGYPPFSSFRIMDQRFKPIIENSYADKYFCLDKLLFASTKRTALIYVDYHPNDNSRYSKFKLFKKFLIFFVYKKRQSIH